jgi:RHS repeat-associated protein
MRSEASVGIFDRGRLSGRQSVVVALLVSLAASLALALGPARAFAEPLCTDTWTGGSEGNWATAGDWSGGVPTSSSVVCIGSGKTVTISREGVYAGVLEDKGGLTVEVGWIDITDSLERSSVGVLTMWEGSLIGPASLAVTGSSSWEDPGTINTGGSLIIEPGVSMTVSGSLIVSEAAKLINEGTFTLASGSVRLAEGGEIENAGTFNVDTYGSGYVLEASGPSSRFINTGTFQTALTGTESISINVKSFENKGTVNAKDAIFKFWEQIEAGGGGKWIAESGHVIFTEGSFTFAGGEWAGSIVSEGGVITAEGVTGTNSQVTVFGGSLSINGSAMTVEGLAIDSFYSTLDVTGSLSVSKSLNLAGSRLTGTGSLTLDSTGSGTISGGVSDTQHALVNDGSMTLSEGYLELREGATLDNVGTFTANDVTGFGVAGETGKVVNTGTFQITEKGTVNVTDPFINDGSVREENEGHFHFFNPVIGESSDQNGGPGNPSRPGQPCPICGEPIVVATGDLVETQTDLAVGGRGVGLDLTRTYNSEAAAKGKKGAFGYGWSSSFSDHLEVVSTNEIGSPSEFDELRLYQADGATVTFIYHIKTGVAEAIGSQDKLRHAAGEFIVTFPSQIEDTFFDESLDPGKLKSVADRDGNVTVLSYGEHERLETITDPAGRKIKLFYNLEGFVERAEDPMGHTAKYTYEGENLASVTLPGEASPRWQFKYDGKHELTEMIDGRGGKTLNEYSGGLVIAQTDPAKRTLRFEYEPFQTKITNESTGSITDERFTSNDEPSAITRGYGTALATTQSFTYNEGGYVTSETNGNNKTTKYGYDGEDNRTSMIDPDTNETRWTYDSTHDVLTTTTPDGETTTIKRESDGNPETISRPTPGGTQTTSYKYDTHGELTSVENPLKETWKYEYDAAGDRTSEVDPENNERTWKYNEDSQEESTVSPRGHATGAKESSFTTAIERDLQGRPIKITDPLGHETKYAYDADGNLETETDPEGNKTTYTYNPDNQPIKVQEPNGTVTETEYDGAGQVISQTDGNKHTTKYTRNVLEEVTEVTDPFGRKTSKEYDKAGNLTSLTDAEKRTTTYKYDPDNRLREVNYSDGKTPTVKYEYNGDGDRTEMTDGTGESTYTYDKLDRLTETKDGHGDTTGYEYNLGDQQTKITYPNGKAVIRTYDNDGRLKSVTDWLEHTTKFAYNPDSELASTTFPSGTSDEDSYAYNDSDSITETAMKKATETLASLVYARDKDERVTKITTKGLPGEAKPAFTYDENSRLTKGTGTNYDYDPANNVTAIEKDSYSYNAADELEKSALKKATIATYTYNEVGQRTKTTPASGPATTYGYDQAGNLTSVSRPKEGETPLIEDSYAYNGETLRTSQTISGTTSYLAWDVAEELPLLINDGSNSYIYGPAGLPIEQIASGGMAVYLHHDQQGSTRLITGSTGAVEGKCTYGAYGTPTCEGTAVTPLGYDAQYTSTDTALIYMRARTYDPNTAQFLSVDPFVALTGEPYRYAEDDPVNRYDPSGRCGFICVGGIVLGGVAVASGVGAVVVGATALATALATTSVVAGAGATIADTRECVTNRGIACVGAGVGLVAAGGAGVVVAGVTGDVAAGASAIGITSGGIGFLSDLAGAIVPGSAAASPIESSESACR